MYKTISGINDYLQNSFMILLIERHDEGGWRIERRMILISSITLIPYDCTICVGKQTGDFNKPI